MGNAEHDGSLAAEVGRKPQETGDGSSQGTLQTQQSTGTSGREDDADVAYASASGLQGDVRQGQTGAQGEPEGYFTQRGWWEFEPNVGRVAHGVPARSHRIKGLGNAVVPQIPEIIGRTILEYEASQ